MATGPKGQKRPARVIDSAVGIAQIVITETEIEVPDDGKDASAKAIGAKGDRK